MVRVRYEGGSRAGRGLGIKGGLGVVGSLGVRI